MVLYVRDCSLFSLESLLVTMRLSGAAYLEVRGADGFNEAKPDLDKEFAKL